MRLVREVQISPEVAVKDTCENCEIVRLGTEGVSRLRESEGFVTEEDARTQWERIKSAPTHERGKRMNELRALMQDIAVETEIINQNCVNAGATIGRLTLRCAGWGPTEGEDGNCTFGSGCGLTFLEQREMLLDVADVLRSDERFKEIHDCLFEATDPVEY